MLHQSNPVLPVRNKEVEDIDFYQEIPFKTLLKLDERFVGLIKVSPPQNI